MTLRIWRSWGVFWAKLGLRGPPNNSRSVPHLLRTRYQTPAQVGPCHCRHVQHDVSVCFAIILLLLTLFLLPPPAPLAAHVRHVLGLGPDLEVTRVATLWIVLGMHDYSA